MTVVERVVGPVGGIGFGAVLAAISAVRRSKAVHPKGAIREAALTIDGSPEAPRGSTLLSEPREHRALVRFSRSIGLPEAIPDLLGIAIRVPDAYGPEAHQDLLFITSADGAIVHHVFLPARGVHARPFSSALPYAAGGRRFLLGVLPSSEGRFHLAVAPLMGRFRPIGELRIGAELPLEDEDLRFNVRENCGGGLAPVGAINRMRDFAYPMSQWAWGLTRR